MLYIFSLPCVFNCINITYKRGVGGKKVIKPVFFFSQVQTGPESESLSGCEEVVVVVQDGGPRAGQQASVPAFVLSVFGWGLGLLAAPA